MDVIHSVLLGLVEGVTEFLPISSTAHLIITGRLLGIAQTPFVQMFEVVIQSGAIAAVLLLEYRYILQHRSMIITVLASFIPTAIIGFVLHSAIKNIFFNSDNLIILSLIAMSFVFLAVEFAVKQNILKLKKSLNAVTLGHALLIGFAQAIAVVPGVSRAGIVMVAMMLMGFTRAQSATYSFLLAVPTIFAASALDLVKSQGTIALSDSQIVVLVTGWVVSFITAYAVIRWLVEYLKHNTLIPFALYRIALAIILLFTLHS